MGVNILPTGVKPERFLSGFAWQDTIWRRGELLLQTHAHATWSCCPTPPEQRGL